MQKKIRNDITLNKVRAYWQKKFQTEVEQSCDNPGWIEWSQPVFDALKDKPLTTKELRLKLREQNIPLQGGLMNALCWLDLHEKIRMERGKWVITGLYNKREEGFNLHEFLKKKAEEYNTTIEAILSDQNYGRCVQARDHICYELRNLGITKISQLLNMHPNRVHLSIDRYKAGKW